MPFNIHEAPWKLSGADMGAFDLGGAISQGIGDYQKGVQAKYAPQLAEAQINQLRGQAQKNMMMSKLLESVMGGGASGEQGSSGGGFLGDNGGGNFKAAVLKAFTGIDPFLQSPEQAQNMKIKGQTESQANKTNLSLGSSNVVREYLQDKMEMPKEYLGASASANMAKDRISAGLGDKEAESRLIKAAVIHKLLPEYVGAQLGSQGIKTTVPALAHQEAAIKQGWGKAANFLTEHMTPEMHAEADRLHNKYVKEINKRREEFNSSGGKRDNNQTSDREINININEEAHKLGVSPKHIIEDSEYFKTTPEVIISALQAGVKTENEMKDWIKGLK
jgi:hypothetical protein